MSIQQMLEKAIDMDSGRYSDLSESILYVTRLAIRVEGYLLFLVRNKKFHSGELGEIQHRIPSIPTFTNYPPQSYYPNPD